MNSKVTIPHGEEKITIELTLKEAIALSGVRFNEHPSLLLDAKRKLKHTIEDQLTKAQHNTK